MGAQAASARDGIVSERDASNQVSRSHWCPACTHRFGQRRLSTAGTVPNSLLVVHRKENAARGSSLDADFLYALSLAQDLDGLPQSPSLRPQGALLSQCPGVAVFMPAESTKQNRWLPDEPRYGAAAGLQQASHADPMPPRTPPPQTSPNPPTPGELDRRMPDMHSEDAEVKTAIRIIPTISGEFADGLRQRTAKKKGLLRSLKKGLRKKAKGPKPCSASSIATNETGSATAGAVMLE